MMNGKKIAKETREKLKIKCDELKAKGFITISGRVNRQYFYERLYGAGNPQGDTTMSCKAGQE